MKTKIKINGESLDVAYIGLRKMTDKTVPVYKEINNGTSARTFTEDEIEFTYKPSFL